MSAQDFQTNNNSSPAMLDGNFTTDEVARLEHLREHFHDHVEYLERLLDERRIEFVRWLIETGRLSETG